MTTKEKGKVYDKVREKIALRFGDNVAEEIFSQFEESGDERIRGAIIDHLKDNNLTEWADWLEKQGETFTKKDVDDAYLKGISDAKNEFEKQGEQKPIPKFKIGEWIIFNENHNSVYQVERIDNYRYYLRHYLGGTLSVHFDSELIRKWTIQDAKDGDVLVSNDASYIVLFKGLSHELEDDIDRFKSYCDHYCEGIFSPIEDPSWCCNAFHPATKEQRDLLFQKMKEAGYEWDAERKELKRIKQEPTESPKDYHSIDPHFGISVEDLMTKKNTADNNVEPKFKVKYAGNEYNVLEVKDIAGVTFYGIKDEPKHIDYVKAENCEMISGLYAIKENGSPYPTKPAEWSEEDENLINSIIKDFETIAKGDLAKDCPRRTKNYIPWLKTIKERVQPQPKQEWSEEEKKRIDRIINVLDWAEDKGRISYSDWEDYVTYVRCLRP